MLFGCVLVKSASSIMLFYNHYIFSAIPQLPKPILNIPITFFVSNVYLCQKFRTGFLCHRCGYCSAGHSSLSVQGNNTQLQT